jgi:hypothetical protein
MNHHYLPPVSQLLVLGEAFARQHMDPETWVRYDALGIGREHIEQLIAIVGDQRFHSDMAETTEAFAPVHAWRVLAQLKATEAIPSLLAQIARIDNEVDDWVSEELPDVFSILGPDALEPLEGHLANRQNGVFGRSCACRSIGEIAARHPLQRSRCIDFLTAQLCNFREEDPFLNGSFVNVLTDLQAVDSIDTIRAAFAEDCVDFSLTGDIQDVEIELGLRSHRTTPPKPDPVFERLRDTVFRATRSVGQPIRKTAKIGRNDLCPCGSGKKYKKCCLTAIDR